MFALLAAAMLVAAGFGARFGVWDFRLGFQLVRWSEYTGLAVAALALVVLVIPKWRKGRVPVLAGRRARRRTRASPGFRGNGCRARAASRRSTTSRRTPRIRRRSSRWSPPRTGLSVPTAYPGAATAEQQKRGYPDLKPLDLPLPPADAFARALAAAKGMGWEIAATDAAAGRIEATATTPWFGFRDDVVIRVAPRPRAAASMSARCRASAGAISGPTPKRIRAFLDKLAHA